MAGTGLIALIDDIALLLDNVATLTKIATRKTAGVLGDDLALNAQQLTGLRAERELPVVREVAVGSLKNKAILVPAALAISALAPWAVMPLLMLGGAFLCFEGVEKVAHKLLHSAAEDRAHAERLRQALVDPAADLVALERAKIKSAVRTDFILSAEIIVISLGTVAAANFLTRLGVLVGIALVMTVGVYGLVAGIVKLDDAGLYLSARPGAAPRRLGAAILATAPRLMKFLSVGGTAAMFLVGGGIVVHGVPPLHHAVEGLERKIAAVRGVGGLLGTLTSALLEALVGVAVGALVLGAVKAGTRLFKRSSRAPGTK